MRLPVQCNLQLADWGTPYKRFSVAIPHPGSPMAAAMFREQFAARQELSCTTRTRSRGPWPLNSCRPPCPKIVASEMMLAPWGARLRSTWMNAFQDIGWLSRAVIYIIEVIYQHTKGTIPVITEPSWIRMTKLGRRCESSWNSGVGQKKTWYQAGDDAEQLCIIPQRSLSLNPDRGILPNFYGTGQSWWWF
jgi:hypothetical protein